MVCQHTGQYQQVRGPAGTLQFYLRHLGWTIDEEATIAVSQFCRFSLLYTKPKRIFWWLHRRWEEIILTKHAKRKAWADLPPLDLYNTRKVLQTYSQPQQLALIHEISGAFQTNVQQAVWDKSVTANCKFCQQPDTREHRIHTCDATADLRANHTTTLAEAKPVALHELPCIHRHPQVDALQMCWDLIEVPDLDEQFHAHLQFVSQSRPLVFYTDGSCHNGSCPAGRHAALAVACDFATDDTQRVNMVAQTPVEYAMPSLRTLVVSRLPGEQNIHRAEIWALLYICEQFDNVDAYVDSQVALHLAIECLHCSEHAASLLGEPDLAIRLWRATRTGTYRFFKVDAHKEADTQAPPLVQYHRRGNQCANNAAITTCKHLFSSLTAMADRVTSDIEQSKDLLRRYFDYILQLMKCRAILDSGAKVEIQELQHKVPEVDRYRNYRVLEPWEPEMPSHDRTDQFAWGASWAEAFGHWLMEIQWPAQDNGCQIQEDGVTWLELALSLQWYSKQWIPLRRVNSSGQVSLVTFQDYEQLATYQVSFAEMADTLNIMWKQFAALHDGVLAPEMKRGLVPSLFRQGATIHSSGWWRRPTFPHHEAIATILHDYFKVHKGTSMVEVPRLPFACDQTMLGRSRVELQGTWTHLSAVAAAAVKQIREDRKCSLRQTRLTFR